MYYLDPKDLARSRLDTRSAGGGCSVAGDANGVLGGVHAWLVVR